MGKSTSERQSRTFRNGDDMQVAIQGKQIELGSALRTYVEDKLSDINGKYFDRASIAHVVFSREGHGHGLVRTHIELHISKSIRVLAEATEGDAYLSFDTALEKAAYQLRKHKERLRDHREHLEPPAVWSAIEAADEFDADTPANDAGSMVIAEMTAPLETLSVSDAVLRLDLGNLPALMFRNASHEGLNMVYRRPDGHVGWVDPVGNEVIAGTGFATRGKPDGHRA